MIEMKRRQIVTELKRRGWTLKRKFWTPPDKRYYKTLSKELVRFGLIGLSLRTASGFENMYSSDNLE